MLIDLIAAVAAGFCGAGAALILRHLSGGRVPGSMIPIFAGCSMLGMAIWSEYTWYDRTVAGFPEEFRVVSKHEMRSALRPWTYVIPFTNRFAAVDAASRRTHPEASGQVLADVYLAEKYGPKRRLPVLVDCLAGRRADVVDSDFQADGTFENVRWYDLEDDDPMLEALCSAG